jgi:hypothetical protein
MHIQLMTALIVTSLVASGVLVMNRGDRIFPIIAILAAGLLALIHFNIISLSVMRFRIDVILPALLTLAGAICWGRASAKSTSTASTLVITCGLIMLLGALRMMG